MDSMTLNKFCLLFLLISVTAFRLPAQTSETDPSQETARLREADQLLSNYRFSEAIAIYREILENLPDSSLTESLQQRILWCENGQSYLQFAADPTPINSKMVSREEFFLYFGDREGAWIPTPNPFSPVNHPELCPAIHVQEASKRIYFSAQDESGSWNIYSSERISDSLWTEPQLLNEHITSAGNEVFPVLSPDGQSLYFSSDGLFGMGKYDLYVCHWDETTQDWGVPENLGFPYSSTEDDWMIRHSNDGLYTILASSRSCPADSVRLYALSFTSNPLRHAIASDQEARRIAALLPKEQQAQWKQDEDKDRMNSFTQVNDSTGQTEYKGLILERRQLEEKMDQMNEKLEQSRANYNKQTNEEDRRFFQEIITENEKEIFRNRQKLDEINRKIQKKELEFLSKGIIPVPEMEKRQEEADAISLPPYPFHRAAYDTLPQIQIHHPEPEFDYSFQILPEARFAENNQLPDRLVYQIQLFVVSNKAGIRQLKGLSPIFERKQKSGKYVYTVGLFSTHSEALSCLNRVRKNGFPKAYIVAFNKGKEVSVKTARQMEKEAKNQVNWQLSIQGYPDGLPTGIVTAIKDSCSKDLAKTVEDGTICYLVGPFPNKSEAQRIQKLLSDLGVGQIELRTIK